MFEKYDEMCRETSEMLNKDAITRADVDAVTEADPDRFDFDIVAVDEAQDWPDNLFF